MFFKLKHWSSAAFLVVFLLGALLYGIPAAYATEGMTPDEQEKWFNEDEDFSPDQINEGELRFLLKPPEKPVLHSLNVLTVNQDSIENGWVLLEQCYKHLDPVPDAEVVYRYKSMRGLRVTSKRNIEAVLVKGQSVQLTNVTPKAELCIKAEVRIFYKNQDGTFSLVNGPFHRKFLDGYYPFHVTLKINYPSSLLKPVQTKPEAQAGFSINKSGNLILIDSYFEGILNTEIIFQPHLLVTHQYPNSTSACGRALYLVFSSFTGTLISPVST